MPRVVRAHLKWSEIPAAAFLVDFFSPPKTHGGRDSESGHLQRGDLNSERLDASTRGVTLSSVKS